MDSSSILQSTKFLYINKKQLYITLAIKGYLYNWVILTSIIICSLYAGVIYI